MRWHATGHDGWWTDGRTDVIDGVYMCVCMNGSMDGWVGVYVVGGMGGWKDAGRDIID